jgi:hypothetical protein
MCNNPSSLRASLIHRVIRKIGKAGSSKNYRAKSFRHQDIILLTKLRFTSVICAVAVCGEARFVLNTAQEVSDSES